MSPNPRPVSCRSEEDEIAYEAGKTPEPEDEPEVEEDDFVVVNDGGKKNPSSNGKPKTAQPAESSTPRPKTGGNLTEEELELARKTLAEMEAALARAEKEKIPLIDELDTLTSNRCGVMAKLDTLKHEDLEHAKTLTNIETSMADLRQSLNVMSDLRTSPRFDHDRLTPQMATSQTSINDSERTLSVQRLIRSARVTRIEIMEAELALLTEQRKQLQSQVRTIEALTLKLTRGRNLLLEQMAGTTARPKVEVIVRPEVGSVELDLPDTFDAPSSFSWNRNGDIGFVGSDNNPVRVLRDVGYALAGSKVECFDFQWGQPCVIITATQDQDFVIAKGVIVMYEINPHNGIIRDIIVVLPQDMQIVYSNDTIKIFRREDLPDDLDVE